MEIILVTTKTPFEKPDPEAEKVEIENQNSIKQSSRLKSASKQSAITRSEKLATSSPIQPAKTTTANSALIEAPKENTIETTTKPPTASRKRGRPKDSLKESSKSNETIKLRKSTRLEECSNNKATRDEGVTPPTPVALALTVAPAVALVVLVGNLLFEG
ncbi:hypothetical protein BY996DRAFT_6424362 [Phakopsora pachyrhizi]|nr:hypothetical protein BY996DRAFT_6424362 [Phakopsora pachyrhizi]